MRLQKEEFTKKEKTLQMQRDKARMGVATVYQSEYASTKAKKRSAEELATAEAAVRLSGGAATQLMRGAMRAVEAAPEEERTKIMRQLAPAYNALSASRVGLSQAREAISRDAVVASQQARHSHQQAFEAMYFEGKK